MYIDRVQCIGPLLPCAVAQIHHHFVSQSTYGREFDLSLEMTPRAFHGQDPLELIHRVHGQAKTWCTSRSICPPVARHVPHLGRTRVESTSPRPLYVFHAWKRSSLFRGDEIGVISPTGSGGGRRRVLAVHAHVPVTYVRASCGWDGIGVVDARHPSLSRPCRPVAGC
jgi:hypothetical protein